MRKQAFTLVETLVAVTVLMLGVVAPLIIATQSATINRKTSNEIIATYLAQDAIADVSAMMKQNTLLMFEECADEVTAGDPAYCSSSSNLNGNWVDLDDPSGGYDITVCDNSDTCAVDYEGVPATDIQTCTPGNGCWLYIDQTTGSYSITDDADHDQSRFQRWITVTQLGYGGDDINEISVAATVRWYQADGTLDGSITVETNIFNTLL